MKLFWISWYQTTEDNRPLHYPPESERLLGWWDTGTRCSDDASTLCSLVEAEDVDSAKAVIQIDWPEAEEWRFCDETNSHNLSDRFPLSDWMIERIAKSKERMNHEAI